MLDATLNDATLDLIGALVSCKILQQTPAHDLPNPDLLALLPSNAKQIIEVGCSHGALARAYKRINQNCHYIGVEIDSTYAEIASNYCDEVVIGDIEQLIQSQTNPSLLDGDCWIFGDTLEHLRDPWNMLRHVSARLSSNGLICACIPNMQHWSIQLRLNTGDLFYANNGLLDRTHLRWFTRKTIISLFESSGFSIEAIRPRIFHHAQTEEACSIIGSIARSMGNDPAVAINDAIPLQYVIRAYPAGALPSTTEQT